jgi:hypothetical protein
MGRDRLRARSSGRLGREIERGPLKPLCLPRLKRLVDAHHPGRPVSSIRRHAEGHPPQQGVCFAFGAAFVDVREARRAQ